MGGVNGSMELIRKLVTSKVSELEGSIYQVSLCSRIPQLQPPSLSNGDCGSFSSLWCLFRPGFRGMLKQSNGHDSLMKPASSRSGIRDRELLVK